MADSTIGSLVAATILQDVDLLVVEQNGEAKKLPGSVLASYIDRAVVSVQVTELSATQSLTSSYDRTTGVLTLGIPRGASIADIEKTGTTGLVDTYTVTMERRPDEASASTFTFDVTNGDHITDVTPVSALHTPGQLDTYRINFVDRDPITFQVYNGADGTGSPGSQTPLMNGTAAVGTAVAYSREDHVHPTDTSRQAATLKFTNVSVSSWSSNSTYSSAGFGYRASVPLTGVTADMFAEVVFSPTQALSGSYAPVCETYAGGVYIYSSTNTAITIPSILVTP